MCAFAGEELERVANKHRRKYVSYLSTTELTRAILRIEEKLYTDLSTTSPATRRIYRDIRSDLYDELKARQDPLF